MTRAVPARARALIEDFEKNVLVAYDDGVGVVTGGRGHVIPGGKVGERITARQSDLWFAEDLAIAAKRVERKIGSVVGELTDNQYGALISFVFNLGVGPSGAGEWKIWGLLRARAFDQIPAQMARFVNAGGKKLNGLVRRRNAEIALWSEAEPGSVEETPSSAVTRLVETPPAPAEKPQKVPLAAQAAACLTTCGVAIKTVSDSIAPFAYQSPVVGQMVATLATVAAALVTLTLVLNWLKHRSDKR